VIEIEYTQQDHTVFRGLLWTLCDMELFVGDRYTYLAYCKPYVLKLKYKYKEKQL
jgi:hypothetical protein